MEPTVTLLGGPVFNIKSLGESNRIIDENKTTATTYQKYVAVLSRFHDHSCKSLQVAVRDADRLILRQLYFSFYIEGEIDAVARINMTGNISMLFSRQAETNHTEAAIATANLYQWRDNIYYFSKKEEWKDVRLIHNHIMTHITNLGLTIFQDYNVRTTEPYDGTFYLQKRN